LLQREIDNMRELCNTIKVRQLDEQEDGGSSLKEEKDEMSPSKGKKKKRKPNGVLTISDAKDDRVQIQFRIGRALVDKIDKAAEVDEVKRNDWMIDAVISKLNDQHSPGPFTATEVTANRIPILFRVGRKVRDRIDRDVKRGNISSRTMWMIEAILSHLDNYEFELA
jgi:hypothetical protein